MFYLVVALADPLPIFFRKLIIILTKNLRLMHHRASLFEERFVVFPAIWKDITVMLVLTIKRLIVQL